MCTVLIRKWEVLGPLAVEERRVLEESPLDARWVAADRDLVRDGERASQCLLLLDGFACRYTMLEDGRRQITAFLIPGDLCDLTGLLLGEMDHAIATLTPAKVAAISHATLLGWVDGYPGLGRALWRDTLIEAATLRTWVVNAGRRTAYERVAHLFCEWVTRLRAVGLARDHVCDLPLTQTELGDALGLSNVHVNRVLQELRAQGLIEWNWRDGVLVVRDWMGLKRAARFDPRYLHQLAPVVPA